MDLMAVDERSGLIHAPSAPVVPVAALYGPNGSGKSASLEAPFSRSERYYNRREILSKEHWRVAHAFGDFPDRPSEFYFDFAVRDRVYTYSFGLDDHRILHESLLQRTARRPRTLYQRIGDDFKFSDYLTGPKQVIRNITGSDTLFLAAAASFDTNRCYL